MEPDLGKSVPMLRADLNLKWVPTVHCNNTSCPLPPIFLPYPNLPIKAPHPPNWPKGDWRAFVVCPICGFGYEYSKPNVTWGDPGLTMWTLDSTTVVYCIGFPCAQPGCKSRVKVYARTENPAPPKAWAVSVLAKTSGLSCPSKHAVELLPDTLKLTPVSIIE